MVLACFVMGMAVWWQCLARLLCGRQSPPRRAFGASTLPTPVERVRSTPSPEVRGGQGGGLRAVGCTPTALAGANPHPAAPKARRPSPRLWRGVVPTPLPRSRGRAGWGFTRGRMYSDGPCGRQSPPRRAEGASTLPTGGDLCITALGGRLPAGDGAGADVGPWPGLRSTPLRSVAPPFGAVRSASPATGARRPRRQASSRSARRRLYAMHLRNHSAAFRSRPA